VSKGGFRGAVPLALLVAFAAGALVDGWLRSHGPPKPVQMTSEPARLKPDTTSNAATISAPPIPPSSAVVSAAPPVVSGFSRTVGTSGDVRSRLRMPIDGLTVESMKGGFEERRGSSRPHEAVDLLAPRDTPVHAVDDGTIAKLFFSKAGGTTIYQFDPSGRLCYYYAHLERYANGLHEGQKVLQGEVIGFVGTSGNAPANTPHLHFAVLELNADRKWWKGRAVDPYLVFKNQG
jgi:murein DD-endopeptidase MepM/ murein hydrolase activator NlpD